MLKKGFKGRCEKQSIAKCEDVCRTYHPIQKEYVKVLSLEDEIVTIRYLFDLMIGVSCFH